MAETISINCLIYGDGPDRAFTVEIQASDNISILKQLIATGRRLSSIDPTDIHLFKVSLTPDELHRTIPNPKDELKSPLALISTIFKDLSRDKVHVFAVLPDTGLKRSAPESVFQLDALKRARVVTESPSQLAHKWIYESLQRQSTQRIFDDRPEPDSEIPPLALLYQGFGMFMDDFLKRIHVKNFLSTVPDFVDVKDFMGAVDQFAHAMSRFYKDEAERRDVGLYHLNAIMTSTGVDHPPRLYAAFIGKVISDGHAVTEDGFPIHVVQFKNEMVGVTSHAGTEAVGYVARLHNTVREERPTVLQPWRVPCIVTTIVGRYRNTLSLPRAVSFKLVIGHEVRFYGVILLGHQYRQISLTPALSCLQGASDGAERMSLYAAFFAAVRLRDRILADLQQHLDNTHVDPIPPNAILFPAVSKLAKYDGVGDFEFKIIDYRYPRTDCRLLYIALAADDSAVLIKFSRTYCRELHEYCYNKGYAPKLLGFQQLPGGWYGIAMEYDPEMVPIHTENDRALRKPIEQLMKGFHEEGWVHGDLRYCNILRSEDKQKVWVVDFDWGGREGEVCYPTPRLNELLVEGRNCSHWKIRREDDERILDLTFTRLGQV
ncbi:protein kinase subdomain-containing protein PKL/ccin9 [Coprinopsis cinerea AmutBmut pab1-1]|nr:protein kinase subdomain-containing protein PKL/ccin9 [Coprinopsis cinerea AmutBmut pab1-1]